MTHFQNHELQSRFIDLKIKTIRKDPTLEDWEVDHQAWFHLTNYINKCIDEFLNANLDNSSSDSSSSDDDEEGPAVGIGLNYRPCEKCLQLTIRAKDKATICEECIKKDKIKN
jgi:hypothetical protein